MAKAEDFSKWLKANNSPEKLISHLGTGKAHTLIEIADLCGLTREKTLLTLNNLVEKGFLNIRKNRKRDYYFIDDKELLTYIHSRIIVPEPKKRPKGMKYARHCYNHLAGYAGVKLTDAMVSKGYLIPHTSKNTYEVTEKGWNWFSEIGVQTDKLKNTERMTKQCLDFSERKNHLGGKLGDALLQNFLENEWVFQIPESREIQFTSTGRKKLNHLIDFSN